MPGPPPAQIFAWATFLKLLSVFLFDLFIFILVSPILSLSSFPPPQYLPHLPTSVEGVVQGQAGVVVEVVQEQGCLPILCFAVSLVPGAESEP